MEEKPVRFTRHAVIRTLSLGFTEDDVVKAIIQGKRQREGKTKFKASLHLKKGFLYTICFDYSDQILIVTVGKGKRR